LVSKIVFALTDHCLSYSTGHPHHPYPVVPRWTGAEHRDDRPPPLLSINASALNTVPETSVAGFRHLSIFVRRRAVRRPDTRAPCTLGRWLNTTRYHDPLRAASLLALAHCLLAQHQMAKVFLGWRAGVTPCHKGGEMLGLIPTSDSKRPAVSRKVDRV
jgi:hypothetical protein